MSDHDHTSPNYSAFDNDHRSLNDDWATRDALGQWDSPYTPGTTLGEALRWYETDEHASPTVPHPAPHTGKLPLAEVVMTFVLGITGAMILSLIF
jgi:hypothetical protein